jgi:hypothetical protein
MVGVMQYVPFGGLAISALAVYIGWDTPFRIPIVGIAALSTALALLSISLRSNGL